ncbi:MAG TPA: SAM-dependent methyltransferase [Chloroflexia bacterium]|jgi:hypothetical protein
MGEQLGWRLKSKPLDWRTFLDKDLGDFQTTPALVSAVLKSLGDRTWARVLEPTCGVGNFVFGVLRLGSPPLEIQAIEVQDGYYRQVLSATSAIEKTKVTIIKANIFACDLQKDIEWSVSGPLLVIGNPPWITNAQLSALGSGNTPAKTNIKGLKGLAAITGDSNFDIAEAIILKIIRELKSEHPTIAMLCKTSVARNVIQFGFDAEFPISDISIRKIDSKKWFNASVDACLFSFEVALDNRSYEARIYDDLEAMQPSSIMGFRNGNLVADTVSYEAVSFVEGRSTETWRQGVKHDAATVMELTEDSSGGWWNRLGENVIVENDYVYPLMKSSDIAKNTPPRKHVIVTQSRVGEDTRALAIKAPKLWAYLLDHSRVFEQRKSSIYKGQPPFSIFGIGEYSFSPFKVVIAGMAKEPRFSVVGPYMGGPTMLDDTCYFLSCHSVQEAGSLADILNSPTCLTFLNATIFPDAKRPITKKLLQRINITALIENVAQQSADDATIKQAMQLLELRRRKSEAIPPISNLVASNFLALFEAE